MKWNSGNPGNRTSASYVLLITEDRFFIITATNLSISYSNDMLTVKLSGFPDMHWRDLFTSIRRQVAHYYLVFKHFLQKRPCNSTQFKTWHTSQLLVDCASVNQLHDRSNSFDWQNTQEKDSSVITAHQSTKRLTLALGIFKLRGITWPFL
jgi:hypothetical protein